MTRHVFGSLENKFAEYTVQYITSTGEIYRNHILPLNQNYARKVVRGTYDPTRAIDGYINVVEMVLPQIKREFNEYYERKVVNSVPHEIKEMIARELQYEYEELLQSMVQDILDKRKKKRVTQKRRKKGTRK